MAEKDKATYSVSSTPATSAINVETLEPTVRAQVESMLAARLAEERAKTVEAVQESMYRMLQQHFGPRTPTQIVEPKDIWMRLDQVHREQRCSDCGRFLTVWQNAGAQKTAVTCTTEGCSNQHEPVGNILDPYVPPSERRELLPV